MEDNLFQTEEYFACVDRLPVFGYIRLCRYGVTVSCLCAIVADIRDADGEQRSDGESMGIEFSPFLHFYSHCCCVDFFLILSVPLSSSV